MAGIGILGVAGLMRTAPVAASEVPFRLTPSHMNTWMLSIDSVALNNGEGGQICVA